MIEKITPSLEDGLRIAIIRIRCACDDYDGISNFVEKREIQLRELVETMFNVSVSVSMYSGNTKGRRGGSAPCWTLSGSSMKACMRFAMEFPKKKNGGGWDFFLAWNTDN